MEKRGDMILYTWEEYLDGQYGPIGTPERDAFEAKVAAEVILDNERVARQELREARKEAHKAKLQNLVMPLVNAIKSPQIAR